MKSIYEQKEAEFFCFDIKPSKIILSPKMYAYIQKRFVTDGSKSTLWGIPFEVDAKVKKHFKFSFS